MVVVAFDDGPEVGSLLARSETSDVVDAHLVVVAVRRSEAILTGDVSDLEHLVTALGEGRPKLFGWPQ